jgi:hypothetical protein
MVVTPKRKFLCTHHPPSPQGKNDPPLECMLSYLIWLHANSIGKVGTYKDKGYYISVESSYTKYTGSVD